MILSDVCEFIVDCPHSTAPDEGKGYPLIRTPNVGKGRLDLNGVHRVSESVYKQRIQRGAPRANDLIFAREAPAGNVALVQENQTVCLGQRTVLIRPNVQKVNPQYLVYYLLSPKPQHELLGTANGATVAHVNLPAIRNLKIELPEKSVQDKIGTILVTYDDLIENNQKQIKLLEEAAQRLYKEWFVDLRFPGHENTKIVDGVPEEWRKFPLEEIAPVVTGKKDANYGDKGGNYPFFTCSQETITAPGYSFDTSAVILAGNGDFNVKLYRGKFEAYQRTYVLAPFDHSNLFNLYFTVQDNMEALAKGASGSTIKFLTKGMLQKILVLTADKKILDKFNDYEENIQQKVEALKKQVEDLTEIRNRLLPKLMSGEVEV